jgi:hypothetical protein
MVMPAEPQTAALAKPSEIVAVFDGWHFTRESVVDPAYVEAFHQLYALAFTPMLTRSPARQVLTDAEFYDQMADERIDKYLAWGDDGQPVGLTTLTTHLEAIPWISPEFFAARFPEQWRRNAVYYLGFTLAHPGQRHQRFLESVVAAGVNWLAAERAVLAYDVCSFNDTVLRFNARILDVLRHHPTAQLEMIDTQVYYGVTFS